MLARRSAALAACAAAPAAPSARLRVPLDPRRLHCLLHLNLALVLLLVLNHELLAQKLLHSACPMCTARLRCFSANELHSIICPTCMLHGVQFARLQRAATCSFAANVFGLQHCINSTMQRASAGVSCLSELTCEEISTSCARRAAARRVAWNAARAWRWRRSRREHDGSSTGGLRAGRA